MAFNNSTATGPSCQSTQNLVASILPPVLIVEMLVGLPSNAVALWIFCCRLKVWRPNTMFLFNLVMADFLLLVSVPFRIDNLIRGEYWIFGGAWCRINLFMLAVNRSASIAFMTAVAVDRYFKVVHPHHRINRVTIGQARRVATGIWVAVIALRLPLLTVDLLTQNCGKSLCRSFNFYPNGTPPAIHLHNTVFILEFFLPLLMLLFCSARIGFVLRRRQMDKEQKVRRAIRAVGVIVAVFIICFLPGIATGLTGILLKKFSPKKELQIKMAFELFSLSIGFTYLNSALDPIIYCFSSSMFRNALKSAVNHAGLAEFRLSRRGSSMTSDG